MLFQDTEVLKETDKPWKPSAAGLMGFLFGPMGGGIVAYMTFKKIGKPQKANYALLISFILSFILLFLFSVLPDDGMELVGKLFGNLISPFIFPAILDKDFKRWEAENPEIKPRSTWASIPWGGLGLILFFSTAVTLDYFDSGANPFADYGTKRIFNSGEIYSSDNIKFESVEKLGNALIADGFFDGSHKSVQLEKNEDCYVLKIIVLDTAINDSAFEPLFQEFGRNVSKNAFDNRLIEIHLTNGYFKTLKIIKIENDN